MNAGFETPPSPQDAPPASLAVRLCLAALVTLFCLLALHFSFARYASFKSHLHDTALIGQSFWSTTQGQFFVNSINPEIGRSPYYFGNHFTPIYFLIAPLYWLAPDPRTLLAVQALLIGLGALPVFALAFRKLRNGLAGLLFAFLYLAHPATWFATLYDFHTEACCVTFVLWAILCAERGHWRTFWAAALLAMGCKEHVCLVFFMLGCFMALEPSGRRRGLGLAAFSLGVFLAVNLWLIPLFSGTTDHPYFAERYGHLGTTLPEVLRSMLSRPLDTLALLLTPRHFYYVACLLGPLFFLSLGSPARLALGLPTFLANGLSSIPITYDIGFYHAASILPGVFWAAIETAPAMLGLLRRRFQAVAPAFWGAVLAACGLYWHCQCQSAILPGLFPPLSPHAFRSDYAVGDHERRIGRLRELLPPGASLSAQFNLAAHFTDRPSLFQFPGHVGTVEFILLDLTEAYRGRPDYRKFWLEYTLQVKVPRYVEAVRELLDDKRYGLLLAEDGFLLFRKDCQDSADRAGARIQFEDTARTWLAYQGRGYGRERHRWDTQR
jgi:uncharacterized membrane protein